MTKISNEQHQNISTVDDVAVQQQNFAGDILSASARNVLALRGISDAEEADRKNRYWERVFESDGFELWNSSRRKPANFDMVTEDMFRQMYGDKKLYINIRSDDQMIAEKNAVVKNNEQRDELLQNRRKISLLYFLTGFVSLIAMLTVMLISGSTFLPAAFSSTILFTAGLLTLAFQRNKIHKAIDDITHLNVTVMKSSEMIKAPKKLIDNLGFQAFIKKFCSTDDVSSRFIIKTLKDKFKAGEQVEEIFIWCEIVAIIAKMDKTFPVDLIPICNVDAADVLEKVIQKTELQEEEESTSNNEMKMMLVTSMKDESKALRSGAMRYLGESIDE